MSESKQPLSYHAALQVEQAAAQIRLIGPKISNEEDIQTLIDATTVLNKVTWELKKKLLEEIAQEGEA